MPHLKLKQVVGEKVQQVVARFDPDSDLNSDLTITDYWD